MTLLAFKRQSGICGERFLILAKYLKIEDLLLMGDDINQSSMSLLEQFVVLLYDRTSDLVKVHDARKWLFMQRSRSLETYH